MSDLKNIRALFFDVFGTCVDWRTTVTDALKQAAQEAVSNHERSLTDSIRARASETNWADFAQQWRETYVKFVTALARDSSIKFKTVDQHHLDSLYDLLREHGLLADGQGSLWDDTEIQRLSLVWHRLAPWPDTCQGIQGLNKHYQTSTLTNGNLSLIRDMVAHGGMGFTHVLSAEMFNSYKPNPAVYLGGAAKLGFEVDQCAMVAAHLGDLQAAKKCGLHTIYVERPKEEGNPELKDKAGEFVDLWVHEGESGFLTVVERLQSV